LVSDIPVLHEVCGDAAIYFDPYNPYAIRKTILQFLANHGDRPVPMIAHHFSWEASAKVLISFLKEKFSDQHN
jgi:glycosyltransferase involved in cell wall biosynthesis